MDMLSRGETAHIYCHPIFQTRSGGVRSSVQGQQRVPGFFLDTLCVLYCAA